MCRNLFTLSVGVYEFTNPEGTFALLAESTISVFLTSTLYLFSFIMTPFYIMALTRLYLQKVPVEDVLLEEGLDYSKTKADKCFFQNIVGNLLAYIL